MRATAKEGRPKAGGRNDADYDSPWKEIIERYFRELMELLFPAAVADIDWQHQPEFLDKELQQAVRDSETGTRYVDKLARVWRRSGDDSWVLVHVELQAQRQPSFAQRMFVYHYRLFDRYRRPVASFAVLADPDSSWRPDRYEHELWGCRLGLSFPVAKLVDLRTRLSEEPVRSSPLSLLIAAHLGSLATANDPRKRLLHKLELTRSLYERGLGPDEILECYRFIDWLMVLPKGLARSFHEELQSFEEELKMPYVTTAERIGIEKGIEQGIQKGEAQVLRRLLERRFGPLTSAAEECVARASPAELRLWTDRILTAESLDDLFGETA